MRPNAPGTSMSTRTAIARAPLTVALALLVIAIGAGAVWGPRLVASWRGDQTNQSAADFAAAIGGAPKHAEGDGHDHAGHEDAASLELSAQALKNIGYEPFTVALRDFERSISLPGMVVERPGKTQYR